MVKKINKIKEARLNAGLTQAKMSEVFKIPKRTIENWETGNRKPSEWAEILVVEKLKEMREDIIELLINNTVTKCMIVDEVPNWNPSIDYYEEVTRNATDIRGNEYKVTKVLYTNGTYEYMAERLYDLRNDKEFSELTAHIYD